MKRLMRGRGAFAIIMLSFIIFQPILSVVWLPYDTTTFHLEDTYASPSLKFWLGTDRYGRDLYCRTIVASRYTLSIAFLSTLICLSTGTFLGLLSAYKGGIIDEIMMRIVDAFLSIPSILLALLVCGLVGASFVNLMLAISFVFIPRVMRVIRGVGISLCRERFIDAARIRGDSTSYIILGELLPNAIPSILVEGTYRVGFAVFIGASLGYLGFGVQPPTPEWGLMIREAMVQIQMSPWVLIWPGGMIVVFIVGTTLLGDHLNEILGTRIQR